MDGQRHGKRGGDRARGRHLLGLLVLALTLAAAACSGTKGIIDPEDGPGGHSGAVDPLLGNWEATLIITVDTDIQSWTTRWTFSTAGACLFRQTIRSVLDGTTETRVRDCDWSVANGALRIVYQDSGDVLEAQYSFVGSDPTRLLFQGVEYRRVTTT